MVNIHLFHIGQEGVAIELSSLVSYYDLWDSMSRNVFSIQIV